MTNADRIRSMTDEELAVYLIKDVECSVARRAGWPLQNDEINRAICTCLIWLKQEEEE